MKAALFYADDGVVASTDPGWLQSAFDMLTGLAPFRGERGVTQGDPLSPTIFNVVVDTVVCHWESLVAEREGGDSSGDNRDK